MLVFVLTWDFLKMTSVFSLSQQNKSISHRQSPYDVFSDSTMHVNIDLPKVPDRPPWPSKSSLATLIENNLWKC